MKPVAIVLTVLAIAALIGMGYLYVSANVTVTGTGCIATDAIDAEDSYNAILDAVAGETFVGTLFSGSGFTGAAEGKAEERKAEDCQFFTYSLRIRNNSFIPAEAVEIQVTPMTGDILQVGDNVRHDLPARSSDEFQVTMLTGKNTHNVRELVVTWYMWGLPFSTRVTYNH